jgi:hypothetical protein
MVEQPKKNVDLGTKLTKANDKALRLHDLAGKRVPQTLKSIERLGALGQYGPTKEQVDAITTALTGAVEKVGQRLRGGVQQSSAFRLP